MSKTDILQEMKKLSFECKLDSPAAWWHTAWMLKRAAEEIDTFNLPGKGFLNHTAKGRDAELYQLMPVYRFLMGRSFENLLKGILIAHGEPAGSDRKLDELNKSFTTHKISELGKKLKNKFDLDDEEIEILKENEPYMLWSGCYPISKEAENYEIVLTYSSEKNRKELELWERLSEHLNDVGWIKKGDGRKIYLKDQAL
jgi:hypothetical protein